MLAQNFCKNNTIRPFGVMNYVIKLKTEFYGQQILTASNPPDRDKGTKRLPCC